MQKVSAFVARSFQPTDNVKIELITKFLDSFRSVGFVWETAEEAAPESVSAKVREKIDTCDVLVAILTKRYPAYSIKIGLKELIQGVFGQLSPDAWIPPLWVLQETGYAIRANKRLILFREAGVTVPGLHGDLEYIPFEPENPASAFQRANEMIHALLARASGIVVEETVRETAGIQPHGGGNGPVREDTQESKPKAEEAPARDHLQNMLQAISDHNWNDAKSALELLQEEEPERGVLWGAVYHRERLRAGQQDGLNELHKLAELNPTNASAQAVLASCLSEFDQYAEAAEYFERAASVSNSEDSIRYSIRRADNLRLNDQKDKSKQLLVQLWNSMPHATSANLKQDLLRTLGEMFKELKQPYLGAAITELALEENPAASSLRFSLGLEYHNLEYPQLFLYHFKLISDREPANSGALHNLGLAFDKCKLPYLSATHYKKAINLGQTLSASNLSHKYLECGMAEDARKLLLDALKVEGCVPEVGRSLARIKEDEDKETEEERTKLDIARKQRGFAVSFAKGYLSSEVPSLSGKWKFPFVEIDLGMQEGKVTGKAVRVDALSGLNALAGPFFGTKPSARTRGFNFVGTLVNRTCEFEVEVQSSTPSTLLGGSESTRKGRIVFDETGRAGEVCEFNDGKPGQCYTITRLG